MPQVPDSYEFDAGIVRYPEGGDISDLDSFWTGITQMAKDAVKKTTDVPKKEGWADIIKAAAGGVTQLYSAYRGGKVEARPRVIYAPPPPAPVQPRLAPFKPEDKKPNYLPYILIGGGVLVLGVVILLVLKK